MYTELQRNVLSPLVNCLTLVDRRSESGMLFHRSGTAFLKALPLKVTATISGIRKRLIMSRAVSGLNHGVVRVGSNMV